MQRGIRGRMLVSVREEIGLVLLSQGDQVNQQGALC